MDINRRKPRVINLRKIKKQVTPVKAEIEPEVIPEVSKVSLTTSPDKCFQCGSGNEDYLRCETCEAKHQEIVAKFETRPKVKTEKVREKFYPFYSVKGGVKFTDWYSEEDLRVLGIPIPKE